MSAHIPIRLQCLPPCDCAEFYSDGSSLRGPTQLQHLKCDSCGHPWFSHLALDILETDALYPAPPLRAAPKVAAKVLFPTCAQYIYSLHEPSSIRCVI